jgi:hypothetical protein
MAKPDLPTIATELYKLLEPHEPNVRQRAIKAAMVMLGTEAQEPLSDSPLGDDGDGPTLPTKVKVWMKTNSLNREQLSQVFHLDGGSCEVLSSEPPGKNGKEKAINAYVLTGISAFVQTGEPKFDDKTARDVCRAMGVFNEGNHAYYLKGKGNLLGGTKDSGWVLTGPGLKLGAELVKQLGGQ